MYKQIVGSLMYLTSIRPDIMHAMSLINRYMEDLDETHLLEVKRILKYVKGLTEYDILYKRGEKSKLFRFTDSDNVDHQHSVNPN